MIVHARHVRCGDRLGAGGPLVSAVLVLDDRVVLYVEDADGIPLHVPAGVDVEVERA